MSVPASPHTMRVYDLVGQQVYDADGKKLGRVHDLVADHQDDNLCVTGLVFGRGGWVERFGWTRRPYGKRVRWEYVERWEPRIVLRRGAGVRDSASS